MSLLNSLARANELFAIHVPMVSQLTRYATPVAIREFDALCSRIELDGESGNFNFEDGLRDIEEIRVAYVSAPRAVVTLLRWGCERAYKTILPKVCLRSGGFVVVLLLWRGLRSRNPSQQTHKESQLPQSVWVFLLFQQWLCRVRVVVARTVVSFSFQR